MDEKIKNYLENLESKISSMSPNEQLQFFKEINEMMTEIRSATNKFHDGLKSLKDEVTAEEILKKIQE